MARDRDDELKAIEEMAAAILLKLEPGQRRRLLKDMAFRLRRSQQTRMRAQLAPDGSAWPARKRQKSPEPVNRPIRFLYRKPGGDVRVADLKSWKQQGDRVVGFDREAEAIRTFLKGRIERHLPPEGGSDPGAMGGSIRGKKGGVRRKSMAMFVRLRAGSNLKAGADPESAWVAFTSRAARIARIHHHGLRDRVAPGGPEVSYPQRQLLGLSQADREALLAQLLETLSTAS